VDVANPSSPALNLETIKHSLMDASYRCSRQGYEETLTRDGRMEILLGLRVAIGTLIAERRYRDPNAQLTSKLVDAPHFRVTIEPKPENGLRLKSPVTADKPVTITRERIGQKIGRLGPPTFGSFDPQSMTRSPTRRSSVQSETSARECRNRTNSRPPLSRIISRATTRCSISRH
jgi:PemK-like, MazF-like toxin of type II toxin-antitoxin system